MTTIRFYLFDANEDFLLQLTLCAIMSDSYVLPTAMSVILHSHFDPSSKPV